MGLLEKLPEGGYRFHTDVALHSRGDRYYVRDNSSANGNGSGGIETFRISWRTLPDGSERIMTDGHGNRMYGN